ncbi:3-dehydroquinate synthase [Candidatus Sumerlaeota bacterium]|nr:3-dehydroquinate synthase [Candidatus Sumerlaeota bacterium]
MTRITVELGERAHPILIGSDLLDQAADRVLEVLRPSHVIIVAQPTVGPSYGQRVLSSFERQGIPVSLTEVPDGEEAKCFAEIERLSDTMLAHRLPRQACLVTVGGGAVGDMGGFAAAIHMRGIAFVQIPTTLLAMVDASVGGKTGINTPRGKNLVGAFWQPRLVLADLDTLGTLAPRQMRAGMAEVIKHGVIADSALFEAIEAHASPSEPDRDLLTLAVRRSCEIKAAVVAEDEREGGRRMILNLGHTIGHAVENLGGYHDLLHGECVAIGMVVAAEIAEDLGMASADVPARIEGLCERAGLPTRIPSMPWPRLLDVMRSDKKVAGDRLRFVLPRCIGQVIIRDDVPLDVVERVFRERGATD